MSYHGDEGEEAPLEEEQIIIPVLSEEVKLENDNSYDNNQEIEIESGNDVRDNINTIGDEVKLENRNGGENYESEESQRQMTTSQDDYELISSKQSSHASINDHEKTPTPPTEIVLQVSPTPSPPPSPISGIPVQSSTTIVVEGLDFSSAPPPPTTLLEMENQINMIQEKNVSFFQSILNGLSVIAEWIRWAFMDNKWGDIFTHKQQI